MGDLPVSPEAVAEPRGAAGTPAAIELRNVSKYLGGKWVLDGVSLTIRRGEIFCLMGGSGAGKSVTLKNMIGLMRPDRGSILLDGIDVATAPRRRIEEIQRRMGYVFQYSALLNSITIFENVALPLREHERLPEAEVRRRVEEVLRLVGLEPADFEKYPAEMSGGMRKRAGLARALVRRPDIVLYDEPTSGLDPVNTARVNELILDMQRKLGVTSVVVTHDVPSMRRIADRAGLLYRGRIHFVGTPAEFDGCEDPVVRQFIRGESHGPITDEEVPA